MGKVLEVTLEPFENPMGMKCDTCGKIATGYAVDPYIEELYPENDNIEEWWCEECYQERLWNI